MRLPIVLAFLIAFFNQMSGINAVLYFSPRIFELAGLGGSAAMLQSIGIGLVNLVFTLLGLWLIDRLGRKTVLLIGSFGFGVHARGCVCLLRFHDAAAAGLGLYDGGGDEGGLVGADRAEIGEMSP